ncbi:MAG TPA: hypothetical protein VGH23_05510 [Rhizomicrobium sp.]|jgi:hypothetical protein
MVDFTNNPMLAPLPTQAPARATPAPATNPFDQFDGHAAVANPFDQFDPPQQAKADSAGGSFARNMLNDATFGLSEPAVAAVQATFGDPTNPTSNASDWLSRYHQNLAALRGGLEADRTAHPAASLAGGLAGGMALPLGDVSTIGGAIRTGAKAGMLYGAGNAVADDQGLDSVAMVMAAGPHALALPTVGFASRMAATALQKGAAQRAIDLAATGGVGAAALPRSAVPTSLARALLIQQAKNLPRLTVAAVPLAVGP